MTSPIQAVVPALRGDCTATGFGKAFGVPGESLESSSKVRQKHKGKVF